MVSTLSLQSKEIVRYFETKESHIVLLFLKLLASPTNKQEDKDICFTFANND